MQYTRLGRTGLQVSRLCLGTMNFGPQTSEAESFTITDRPGDQGVRQDGRGRERAGPIGLPYPQGL